MAYQTRSFSRDVLGDFLEFVANNAKARWPSMTYMMTGDVAWQLPGSAPKDNVRLWYDGRGVAGYAWFEPTSTFKYDLRVGLSYDDGLADEMLAWAQHRRMQFGPGYPFYYDVDSMDEWADGIINPSSPRQDDECVLIASVFENDAVASGYFERKGFSATKHFEPFLIRSLDDIPRIDLPEGMTLKHVEEQDFEERVATHSAAWWPATGFNMQRYLKVREQKVFDPELDIVAEASDGTFASYCICWSDAVSRVGSYEPFGTRPEWRGTGVSRAVIYEGLRRLKSKGMKFARTYTAGFNHKAFRLYQSCGFNLVDRSRTYMKTV